MANDAAGTAGWDAPATGYRLERFDFGMFVERRGPVGYGLRGAASSNYAPVSCGVSGRLCVRCFARRGRAALEALKDEHSFMSTFAYKAVVLTPVGASEMRLPDAGAASAIAGMNPNGQVKSASAPKQHPLRVGLRTPSLAQLIVGDCVEARKTGPVGDRREMDAFGVAG